MKENIALNKVQEKIEAVLGDVNKVVPRKYKGKFDRVVMPLPKGGEHFLAAVISSIKPSGGTIHFYQFVPLEDPYTETLQLLKEECKKAGRSCKILNKKEVRSFSASTIQIVVDFKLK